MLPCRLLADAGAAPASSSRLRGLSTSDNPRSGYVVWRLPCGPCRRRALGRWLVGLLAWQPGLPPSLCEARVPPRGDVPADSRLAAQALTWQSRPVALLARSPGDPAKPIRWNCQVLHPFHAYQSRLLPVRLRGESIRRVTEEVVSLPGQRRIASVSKDAGWTSAGRCSYPLGAAGNVVMCLRY
jgi:hypothetical protein